MAAFVFVGGDCCVTMMRDEVSQILKMRSMTLEVVESQLCWSYLRFNSFPGRPPRRDISSVIRIEESQEDT